MEDYLENLKDENEIKIFKKYIDIIKKEKGLSEKEIINMFKNLKEELDSIITDTESLFEILLGRLGIKKERSFVSTTKKISEVKEGEYVNVEGNVINVRISEKLAILKIYDDTGSIKVVSFEPYKLKDIYEGSRIKIIDGFVRETNYGKEIILGRRSKIEIIEKKEFPRKKISEIKEENEFIENISLVVNVYETKIIERKIEKDGKEMIIEKPITPLLLADSSGRILAYYEGRVKNLEGKTVLVRGRSFLSQKGDIRLNLRTLIELNTENEILEMDVNEK